MADVEFDEQKYDRSQRSGDYQSEKNSQGISGAIISSGLAKNYRQSAVIMIIIIIALIAAAIFIFKHFGDNAHQPIQVPEESLKTSYSV